MGLNVEWLNVTGNEAEAGGHLQADPDQGYSGREAHGHQVQYIASKAVPVHSSTSISDGSV